MRASILVFSPLVGSAAAFAESAAGLQWAAPAGWKNTGASSMRAATYTGVYFFGAGQGGNIFLEFTGPTKTVAANERKVEQLLASFQRASQDRSQHRGRR